MMIIQRCATLLLLHCLAFTPLYANDNHCLKTADELFEAGFYTEALDLYKNLLASAYRDDDPLQPAQIRFHLAQCYLSLSQHADLIDLLSPPSQQLPDALYLLALSYQQQENFPLAIQTLQHYLDLPFPSQRHFYDEARFELALTYFLNHDNETAVALFKTFSSKKQRLQLLAQIYLARLAIAMQHPSEAISITQQMKKNLVADDPLRFDISYIQGEAFFHQGLYDQAIISLTEALPHHPSKQCCWLANTLYYLGWSHLKLADSPFNFSHSSHFDQAIVLFQQLINEKHPLGDLKLEDIYLALGQAYLRRAKNLNDLQSYLDAETLLSQQEHFLSSEAQTQALLLLAEAAPTYSQRHQLYHQLTTISMKENPWLGKGWYMKALNDFDQGNVLSEQGEHEKAMEVRKSAIAGFQKAFKLLKDDNPQLAAAAIKYEALATSFLPTADAHAQAFAVLDTFFHEHPQTVEKIDNDDEYLYLHGFFAAHIKDKISLAAAEESLTHVACHPNSAFAPLALLQLGTMYYSLDDWKTAETKYLQLYHDFPQAPQSAEALLWAACCADQLREDPAIAKERRKKVFEEYPNSCWAPEAYFTFYSLAEYLQGDKTSLRHLQSFVDRYTMTPWLIDAYYLIGLDHKRDRKTPEGKWIRKRNLTEAIDAFQQVETIFDTLMKHHAIPADKLNDYIVIRYQANKERANANLAIAGESQGAKRKIYLEYSEEVFKELVQHVDDPDYFYGKIQHSTPSPSLLYEESAFGLAQTYIQEERDDQAEQILDEMYKRYEEGQTSHSYYLSRLCCEKGDIAFRRGEYHQALDWFQKAENAAKGIKWSSDQKLDLWIQQSLCYNRLGQYDRAILTLSKVINDDAISSLRLKAMYLRAEIYEEQKRPELARKQLESLADKGGRWAVKAKEKLKKEYGY